MHTYIALLRGINVGGHHKLPMRDLRQLLTSLGLHNVNTYIQSGNVVFQSERERTGTLALAEEISAAIGRSHGFTPQVFILDVATLQEAMAANPFPEGEAEPKTLHLFFLDGVPLNPDLDALEAVRKESERFALVEQLFYLHAPEGIGRSKLVDRVGRGWGVTVTARNWRTVSKVLALAKGV